MMNEIFAGIVTSICEHDRCRIAFDLRPAGLEQRRSVPPREMTVLEKS
jgi:hypothetical protein